MNRTVYNDAIDSDFGDLELFTRTIMILWRAGVRNTAQLVALTEAELLKIPQIGPGAVANIRDALGERGLALASD